MKIQCTYCPDRFLQIDRFIGHAILKHYDAVIKDWFECPDCKKYFPSEEHLKNHQSSHQTFKRRETKCLYCNLQIPRTRYIAHVNKEHFDAVCNVWKICDKCSLYFPTEQVLSVHHLHCRNPGVVCQFCPNRFSRNEEYLVHANAEHKDLLSKQWLHCPDCDFFVETEVGLVKHLRESHTKRVDTLATRSETNQAINTKQINFSAKRLCNGGVEAGRVHCQFCSERFFTSVMSMYYNHANEVHSQEVQALWLRCQDCDRFYPTNSSLSNHQRYTVGKLLGFINIDQLNGAKIKIDHHQECLVLVL